ncbi:hypothetical protein TUMSATVNIG1_60070 (plasmid) [Vibrio nigripulchritudo]|uniref:DNA adenine methylase n=1 Tax=Vibrio nigripulchritudo TaxID=28173 RepID=UPI0024924B08|nr:DNA adenine methylase [Vibrio nigripulchritudo]BDU35398.1 hypothetical protein TUMSATVNIG1_60070 [Vibrio nigripulchritudo]
MKPLVKWPGGKTWLAKSTKRLIEDLKPKTVIEPFGGSGAFSFFFEFEKAIINDTNIAFFYNQLQAGHQITPERFELTETFYDHAKLQVNESMYSGKPMTAEDAGLFWFMVKHGFNGLVRQNKRKGHFNVPFGLYDKMATPPDTETFLKVARRWSFINGSYTELDYSIADLIVTDPPYEDYNCKNKKMFRAYTGDENTDIQNTILNTLPADKPTIATNILIPQLVTQYKQAGFKVFSKEVTSSISGKTKGRQKRKEMVAFRGFTRRKLGSYVSGLKRL